MQNYHWRTYLINSELCSKYIDHLSIESEKPIKIKNNVVQFLEKSLDTLVAVGRKMVSLCYWKNILIDPYDGLLV